MLVIELKDLAIDETSRDSSIQLKPLISKLNVQRSTIFLWVAWVFSQSVTSKLPSDGEERLHKEVEFFAGMNPFH